MIKRLALIGVGLIGGSLSLALKRSNQVEHVVGYARTETSLKKGVELNILDSYSTSLEAAVADCDVVVLAVPLGAMSPVLQQIAPRVKPSCVITDAGSAKATVATSAKTALGSLYSQFVPGHPIAGTEHSGVESGFAELFQQRKVILTPDEAVSTEALTTVQNMWQACGAQVEIMSVEHHDQIFAATSHLPHMLAYSLVNCLAKLEDQVEIFKYAAGGFRDISRVASSNPNMWRDVCVHNKQALAKMMHQYSIELAELAEKIDQSDEEGLYDYFEQAKTCRDKLIGSC
ncbi:MAG: prephenate dehydrogenase/arogenate dehydrogenase family protein [Gammaproteobacteria bacterium]|nr:prephenate dehydrogenase/arogenate dehydrogenase family protein [Gammaproteobacteria bacterium]